MPTKSAISSKYPPADVTSIENMRLISERELSLLTGIPRGTLSRWRCAGKGPNPIKMEGTVRYHLRDVLKYVAECEVPSVRASMEEMRVSQKKR